MKIIGWNINGARGKSMDLLNKKEFNKKSELGRCIDKYQPDVVCFGETKCQTIHTEMFKCLPFKYQTWICSQARKGYSGACIMSNIEFIDHGSLPIHDNDIEGRSRIVEFPECILVYVYTPNSGAKADYRIDWDIMVLDYLMKMKLQDKMVIYCGDMNVVHKDYDIYDKRPYYKESLPGLLRSERIMFSKFLEAGYLDIYRHRNPNIIKYTWWNPRVKGRDRNIGWRIDHFLVRTEDEKKIKNVEICDDIKGSDHCPIFIEIEI